MCDEDTGMCTCAASLGYSGGENNKCDACLDGWIWTASDSTCTGKFFFWKITTFLVDLFLTMFWISDCGCNLSGTMGGSSTCDETGICTCDASAGYSGGQNGKCDDCLDGWYWTASDSTCRSKIISSL